MRSQARPRFLYKERGFVFKAGCEINHATEEIGQQ